MISVVQQPGDTIYVPKNQYHATCTLDDWTIAVGMQRGSLHSFEQKFDPLPQLINSNNILDETIHPMPWSNTAGNPNSNTFQKKCQNMVLNLIRIIYKVGHSSMAT